MHLCSNAERTIDMQMTLRQKARAILGSVEAGKRENERRGQKVGPGPSGSVWQKVRKLDVGRIRTYALKED